jgi:MarR family transcriptional regulator, organic hydroperoxide resistance regulator
MNAPSFAQATKDVGETSQRRPLSEALDIAKYASGTAGEAWALLARVLFLHGKPRMPAIAGELGLHPGQAIVVRLLDEPRPMGELADAMHCDNSNITGIVDRLEERGLVERGSADYDRRVKLIALTPDGRHLREELNRRFAEPPEALTRLSAEDQRTLRDILRRAVAEPEAGP